MKRLLLALLLPAAAISPTALALPEHGPDMHDIPHIDTAHPDSHASHAPVNWPSAEILSHQQQVIIVQPAPMDKTDAAAPTAHDSMNYAPALRQSQRQARHTAAQNIQHSGGLIDNANSRLQELGLYSGGR